LFRASPTFLVNPPTADVEKTVVVLGAFRGGTSMVAQLLMELGVFMGEEFAAPDQEYENIEDREFQDLLHRWELLEKDVITPSDIPVGVMGALLALIEKRNREHALWGWKYPGTVIWCLHAGLSGYLRHPHFITVFRDPLAVFQHEADKGCIPAASVRRADGMSFRWVARQNERLAEHVMRSDAPHLLVSYERAINGGKAAKDALADRLASFLHPALPGGRRSHADSLLDSVLLEGDAPGQREEAGCARAGEVPVRPR
jgi:hypothetical protein